MIVDDSFSCDARSSTVLLAYYMTFNSIIIIINYFNYHYVRRRRTHTNRVVSRESLSRVLWTSPKGKDRDAMRFRALGAILDWRTRGLAGWQAMWHK